jgi:methyl-accepting chemotaxis protein
VNFDDAIQVHAAWKARLAAYIESPDGRLQSSEIGADNRCQLGQWLHGEAEQEFSSLPEYQALISEHTRFHRLAGKIVDRVNSGEPVNAVAILGGASEYATASLNVAKAILDLRAKVE